MSSLPTPGSTPTTPSRTPSSNPSTGAATRSAIILPGLGNNTGDYGGLSATLKESYGIPCVVAKVSRFDWFRNAAGLLDQNYWKGTLRPRPVLDWYLERVSAAVSEAKELCPQGGSVALIGHSAGGWLARVYLEEFGWSDISLLLTLGTPHLLLHLHNFRRQNLCCTLSMSTRILELLRPLPKGIAGAIDQTRGLLDYVEKNCQPAVYTPELKYICIAGRYIHGAHLDRNPSSDVTDPANKNEGTFEIFENDTTIGSTPAVPTIRAHFVGQGYKQVCGMADVWGDGVVPEMSAHLNGALNISFEGVYHSPVGSDDKIRPWYGSPAVVQKWVKHLLN